MFLGTGGNDVYRSQPTPSFFSGIPESINDNVVYGLDGNDEINIVRQTNAYIDGGRGDDTLYGSGGPDIFYGGEGNDDINVFYIDRFSTGIVFDPLRATGSSTVFGGSGNDEISSEKGSDLIFGDLGNDTIYGSTGLRSDGGQDFIDGGEGNDRIDAGNSSEEFIVNPPPIVGIDDRLYGGAGNDTVYGGAHDDIADGGAGVDALFGGVGNDFVAGGTENDYLYGQGGLDALYGQDGDDALIGGAGADLMFGGAGNDIYEVTDIGDQATEEGSVYGGGGFDIIYSSVNFALATGIEQLVLVGTAEYGYGGSADNVLVGNDLDNILEGGAGYDLVTGGVGADRFVCRDNFGVDVITDFWAGGGARISSFSPAPASLQASCPFLPNPCKSVWIHGLGTASVTLLF